MKRLLVFVVFFAFSKSDNAGKKGLCEWQNGVNLTYIEKLKPIIGNSYSCEVDKYTYTINICGSEAAAVEEYNAVVQQETGKKKVVKVGDMRDADLVGGSDWLMMWFNNGDPYGSHCGGQNRSAVVMVKCNTWAGTGSATALEENTDKAPGKCHYLFEIETALVCPPKKGLSAGSIFVIIFFVAVMVYLIVGCIYQRCVNRASGWEQIPNQNFWLNFGALQADGCNFLCRCGDRLQTKEYRNIDDAISESQSTPRQEARDDSLLNM